MMSSRIVIECDECLALDERREGTTVTLAGLGVEVEVDLCVEHRKVVEELLARLVDLGRSPGEVGIGRVKCPRCSRSFGSPQALGRHTKGVHGETVDEARLAVEVQPADAALCPECGAGFSGQRKRQALGAHRNRAHGVTGASRQAAERRASSNGLVGAGEVREGE